MQSNERKSRRKFTPEFKKRAVKRVLSVHKAATVARALGYSEGLLHTWGTRHWLTENGGAVQA